VMQVLHVAARPEALPCREEEYGWVLRAVAELLEEGSGGCVCEWLCWLVRVGEGSLVVVVDISGMPGTGKTATVYAIVQELKRMAASALGICDQAKDLLPYTIS
jgi:origin recognition complex subunit 1